MIDHNRFAEAWRRLAEPENQARVSSSSWRIIMSFGAVLTIVGVLYGGYEFLQPVTPASGTVTPSTPALDKEELRAVIEKLDARTARFNVLIEN